MSGDRRASDPPSLDLPAVVRDWPTPRGRKTRPARWRGTRENCRQTFQNALDERGPDALAVIRRHGHVARADTLWFAPGVPMHTNGTTQDDQGRTFPLFLVPARAALDALADGRIHYRDDHPIQDMP